MADLRIGRTVELDANGSGEIRVGPEGKGPPRWHITGVILRTSRPGEAPVPRAEVFVDFEDASGREGLTYDGSFASGTADITLTRGQELIVRWTGGQAGDIASLTLTGEKLE